MAQRIRFYAPLSDGAFQDVVDDLAHAGVVCTSGTSSNFQRCTSRGARYIIANDPDQLRVQLLDEGGLGTRACDAIDAVLSRASAPRTSFSEHVGGFYYDADLAKFGNAFSPFVQSDSFERTNLALQRPFEDRYNPRYENQPTWAEWMKGGEYVGAPPLPTPLPHLLERLEMPSVDRRLLVMSAALAGVITLFALRNKG